MSPPSNPEKPSLATTIRAIAAKQNDPIEKESLLNSARKIEDTDRMVNETLASCHETHRRWVQANLDSIKRRNDLPPWVVVFVLVSFFAFLAYVSVKYHL